MCQNFNPLCRTRPVVRCSVSVRPKSFLWASMGPQGIDSGTGLKNMGSRAVPHGHSSEQKHFMYGSVIGAD